MWKVNLDKIRASVFWAKIADCFNSLPRWTYVLSSSLVSQNHDFISKILPRGALVLFSSLRDSAQGAESWQSILDSWIASVALLPRNDKLFDSRQILVLVASLRSQILRIAVEVLYLEEILGIKLDFWVCCSPKFPPSG